MCRFREFPRAGILREIREGSGVRQFQIVAGNLTRLGKRVCGFL